MINEHPYAGGDGVITYFIPCLFLFASAVRIQSQPLPPASFRLPGRGPGTVVALACIGFLSTAGTVVLSLFPAEDDAHPALTLFKILTMTLVLLTAGVAIYRSSHGTNLISLLDKGEGRSFSVYLKGSTHEPISRGTAGLV
jgi:hypothetical protein